MSDVRLDAWKQKLIFQRYGASYLRDYLSIPYIEMEWSQAAFTGASAFSVWNHLPFTEFLVAFKTLQGVAVILVQGNEASIHLEDRPGVVPAIRRVDDVTINTNLKEHEYYNNEALLGWIVSALTQLTATPDHLVEVTPDTTDRDRKSAVHKPWARRDLPRIILMTPGVAKAHGHRVARGGTHASPRIHQRRGCWKTLRHARYRNKQGQRVWCKPAWVGDREWAYQGSRYRVIMPTDLGQNKEQP